MRANKKLDPEKVFRAYLKQELDYPQPLAEYRFDPKRRWRFDYAWVAAMIALEIEGGVWTRGRHTRGAGFLADCEKYNAAAVKGWIVIRVTPEKLCTSETITLIDRALRLRAV